jgi:hypothetical protein
MKKFIFDLNFRDSILSKIKDPRFQLCLTYSFPAESETGEITQNERSFLELLLTHQSNKLAIKENTNGIEKIPGWIGFLNQRNYVRLEKNDTVENFQGLESLNRLKLQDFTALSDISPFSQLSSLCLRQCPLVKDVSALKKLKRIVLEFCDGIEDISPLSHVYYIVINGCENIARISCLTQNEKIDIRWCPNINDAKQWKNEVARSVASDMITTATLMAGFPNAEIMTLFAYEDTRNFAINPKLRWIEVYTSVLTDTSRLSSLHHVVLCDCNNLKELKELENVQNLIVKFCSTLSDISKVGGNNKNVYFEDCPLIKDFSSLREVPRIWIKGCFGFTNGYDIAGAKIIILDSCSNISDVSMLGNAEEVELRGCDGITSIEGLENVPTIVIENCQHLKSLKGLGSGSNEFIILDVETAEEPEVAIVGGEEEEEEADEHDYDDYYLEIEPEDKDDLIVKPLRPHPLVEDPVIIEYYQLIGFSSCPSTGRTSYSFGKKR